MPRVQYALSSYERARGDLPALPVINMVAEQAPTEDAGVMLQSRPGLMDRSADVGSDVDVLFRRDGVLGGDLFAVSSGMLYRNTGPIGPVAGDAPASIAGNEIGLMTTAGADLYYYDGAALHTVWFPDGAPVAKVFAGAARFWIIRRDTGKIYWTPPLGSTIGGLDFATAESLPDKLLDALWIDDTAVLFGAESVEFWPNTQDPDLPIQPLEGRVFEKGIRATGCAVVFNASFAWVTNDNTVCVNGQKPEPISNAGLNAQIEASAECRLFTFLFDGQEFLALRLDGETHVYGAENRMWSEFVSHGEANWLPKCWAAGIFGCSNGATATWGPGYEDFGGELERTFRAGFPLNSGGVTISNVILRSNVGQTPYLTGPHADPVVEMRVSRDAGKTWSHWRRQSAGRQGRYRNKVAWRACGMASAPGHLSEFRVASPVAWRVSDVLINEPDGGR